jgi:hypothetical protein
MDARDVGETVIGVGTVVLCAAAAVTVAVVASRHRPKWGEGRLLLVAGVIFLGLMLAADSLLS